MAKINPAIRFEAMEKSREAWHMISLGHPAPAIQNDIISIGNSKKLGISTEYAKRRFPDLMHEYERILREDVLGGSKWLGMTRSQLLKKDIIDFSEVADSDSEIAAIQHLESVPKEHQFFYNIPPFEECVLKAPDSSNEIWYYYCRLENLDLDAKSMVMTIATYHIYDEMHCWMMESYETVRFTEGKGGMPDIEIMNGLMNTMAILTAIPVNKLGYDYKWSREDLAIWYTDFVGLAAAKCRHWIEDNATAKSYQSDALHDAQLVNAIIRMVNASLDMNRTKLASGQHYEREHVAGKVVQKNRVTRVIGATNIKVTSIQKPVRPNPKNVRTYSTAVWKRRGHMRRCPKSGRMIWIHEADCHRKILANQPVEETGIDPVAANVSLVMG